MRKPPLAQKDVLNPEEALQYFGFSRRKFFGMLRAGKFKKYTALYGRRRLICGESLKSIWRKIRK